MSLLIDLTKQVRGKDISKVCDATRNNRLTQCNNCELLGAMVSGVCGDGVKNGCGCIVSDKSKYRNEHCPEGKWENGLKGSLAPVV